MVAMGAQLSTFSLRVAQATAMETIWPCGVAKVRVTPWRCSGPLWSLIFQMT